MKISPSYLRVYVTLLASLLVFTLRDTVAQSLGAQSLGELSRQERARKHARQTRVTKVYTNEDLAKDTIVDPASRALESGEPVLAEAAQSPAEVPVRIIPVQAAAPARENTLPTRAALAQQERSVPTVPVWPAGMPLGDIARYYRQQIAPQIPLSDDRLMLDALANRPSPDDFTVTAPFVMAAVEGSSLPVIENVVRDRVPEFPAIANMEVAENSNVNTDGNEGPPGLAFASPALLDLTLELGAGNASLEISETGLASTAGSASEGRVPLTIRFAEPTFQPAAVKVAPVTQMAAAIPQPEAVVNPASNSDLVTVSAWTVRNDLTATPPAEQVRIAPVRAVAETVLAQALAEAGDAEVRVQRGDSLWRLAQRHLGDGRAWPQIAALNPQLQNPHFVRAGERLHMPTSSASLASLPIAVREERAVVVSSNPAREVMVQRGDSLWKLAETALGRGAAWSCIAEANPQISDSDRIYPGQSIVLPESCIPQA